MKGRILVTLFALPFFAVGVWMLWTIGNAVYDAARMSSWVPVEAHLESGGYVTNRGDDSDSYEAYASYRYAFNAQSFTGDRVAIMGGGDNVGGFQQNLGTRLARAMASGEPIVVYVNPDEPSEAVIDRSLRLGLLGFRFIFVLLFGGVGGWLLCATWTAPKEKDRSIPMYADAPWLLNDKWQTESIRSDSKAAMTGAWVFAGIWNLVSVAMPFLVYDEIVEKQNYLALVGLLFPLIGLGLLGWAVVKTREWRRFGATPVVLDPFPGSIGGHVGGTVDIGLPYDSSVAFVATLTSIHSYISGSGKNRSRRENALWQDEIVAHAEASARGMRVSFRFDVPQGQRESDAAPDDDSYNLWRLNLRANVPGADLDRDFEIPVYATARQSRAISDRQGSASGPLQNAAREQSIRDVVRVKLDGIGKKLVYPMGRNLFSNLAGALVGGTFAFAGYWLVVEEGATVFGAVCGGVGGLVALAATWMMFRSLEVSKQGNTITSVRRWLGIPVRKREMQVGDFYRFEKDRGMQSQNGGKHQIFYRITAIDRNANEILLGEGFRGESGADAAIDFLSRELGLA